MRSTSLLYRGLVRSGIVLAPAFSSASRKLRTGLEQRAGVVTRLTRWARVHREPARPLLWMHAASVGESLQAAAVLELLRGAHPDWQIAFTYFSPSAAAAADRLPADFVDCLPWDRPGDVEAALEALRPAALVFSKLDLWPELATRAARGGTEVGIVAASVSRRSRRLRWPARALLRAGYGCVSRVGAVAEQDVPRLVRLGVAAERIELTGDPRCDSALDRARGIRSDDPWLRFARLGPVLVAGSTWPADEAELLAAFAVVRRTHPAARLVLAPHEPTPERLAQLVRLAESHGGEPAVLQAGTEGGALQIVDRVGVLATLYAGAAITYVGGGFGRRGLHSVLEPAACGVVVLVGPDGEGNRDAAALIRGGGAAAVSASFPEWLGGGRVRGPARASLGNLWSALLGSPAVAQAAGRRGRAYVEAGAGAAARNAGLVERLMAGSTVP